MNTTDQRCKIPSLDNILSVINANTAYGTSSAWFGTDCQEPGENKADRPGSRRRKGTHERRTHSDSVQGDVFILAFLHRPLKVWAIVGLPVSDDDHHFLGSFSTSSFERLSPELWTLQQFSTSHTMVSYGVLLAIRNLCDPQ